MARARCVGSYRLVANLLKFEYHDKSFEKFFGGILKAILGLLKTFAKRWISSYFPWTDERNARQTIKERQESAL